MKYSGKVMIEKVTEKSSVRVDPRNPHSRDNVNVAQGPRSGNNPAMGKRSEFKDAKEARQPLADTILKAFAARDQKDYVDSKLEPVSSNTRAKFKR